MLTPIDFGKRFLRDYFTDKDADACLNSLADDVVWIVGDVPRHFRSREEIREFLVEDMDRRSVRRETDIAGMMSSPGPEKAVTVAYSVNLVIPESRDTERFDCSLVICKNGLHNEITFLHFSRRDTDDPMKPVLEFMNVMPCGIMIISVTKKDGMKVLAFNDYFCEKLRYTRVIFDRNMQDEPFFMSPDEDKKRIEREILGIYGTDRNFSLNLSMRRKDGQTFQYRMNGGLAYRGSDEQIYYCVLHEITGFTMMNEQLRDKYEMSQEILKYAPGAFCALNLEERDGEDVVEVLYTSPSIPELFGCTANYFAYHMQSEIFYEFNMTSVTKERLIQDYIKKDTETVSAGIYDIVRPDKTTYRVELYITSHSDDSGKKWVYLGYSDREALQEEVRDQVSRAEKMAHIQVEKAREEAQLAKQKANERIAAEHREMEERIKEEKAGMQKLLDIRKFDYERMEQKYQKEKEELEKQLEEKKQDLYAKIDRLQQQLADQRIASAAQITKLEKQLAEKEDKLKENNKPEEFIQKWNRFTEDSNTEAPVPAAEQVPTEETLAKEAKIRSVENEKAYERLLICRQQEAADGNTSGGSDADGGEASAAAAVMMEDFTGMSETDTGQTEEEKFELGSALRSVMLYLSIQCRKEGIGLVMINDKGMAGEFAGDKRSLQRIMCSLLENSAGRCKKGGKITLSCQQDHSGEQTLLSFHIRDDGKEIPGETLRVLFEQSYFMNADQSEAVHRSLFSSKELLEKMGGRIQVLSRGLKGTEFIVTVPMKEAK